MRKPRIIIFDDDDNILGMLKTHFIKLNFEVQDFNQPVLCQDCESLNPCADIIITDFQMPLINGIELLDHQAQRGCTVNIRNKAIMSAILLEEHSDKMSKLAGTFLQKPFSLRQINEWTQKCISRVDLSQPLGSYLH